MERPGLLTEQEEKSLVITYKRHRIHNLHEKRTNYINRIINKTKQILDVRGKIQQYKNDLENCKLVLESRNNDDTVEVSTKITKLSTKDIVKRIAAKEKMIITANQTISDINTEISNLNTQLNLIGNIIAQKEAKKNAKYQVLDDDICDMNNRMELLSKNMTQQDSESMLELYHSDRLRLKNEFIPRWTKTLEKTSQDIKYRGVVYYHKLYNCLLLIERIIVASIYLWGYNPTYHILHMNTHGKKINYYDLSSHKYTFNEKDSIQFPSKLSELNDCILKMKNAPFLFIIRSIDINDLHKFYVNITIERQFRFMLMKAFVPEILISSEVSKVINKQYNHNIKDECPNDTYNDLLIKYSNLETDLKYTLIKINEATKNLNQAIFKVQDKFNAEIESIKKSDINDTVEIHQKTKSRQLREQRLDNEYKELTDKYNSQLVLIEHELQQIQGQL
jgi:hypothetical protein